MFHGAILKKVKVARFLWTTAYNVV